LGIILIKEKETREKLIDKKLLLSDWDISNNTKVVKEFHLKRSNEKIDYVLLGRDGKPLAVVEAKKSSSDARLGQEQAKQYCYNLKNEHNIELPFCFYTNGNDIYFWDIENYPPRKIYAYPSREDLERLSHIQRNKKSLSLEFIDTNIAGRDYQVSAIRSIMEAIDKKRRDFLLVMATGTGKTRTTLALIEALLRAGYIKNTLFLVDRVALREQAIEAFKEYIPSEPIWPKFGESSISKDRRIYVSTYQSMLNIIRDEEQTLSSHFFDLIVIDESHRSIYNTYGEILEYFDAIKLGLTATPTNVIDHNTFELFSCEDGLPTFAYSYEEALDHIPPYLCDFEVLKIKTKFQDEGLSKRSISLEDQKKMILEGKEIEEINYEGTQLEKDVTNTDTNRLIVKEFIDESIKDQNGVLPTKSIFFCMTKAHARRVEELFNSLYPEYKGELAKVIVSDDSRAYGKGGLLDQFKTYDMPRVAISVGMLDTGVDIKEVSNLVFAKPIYSYTKFWQMIGRGTRLLDTLDIKPWCKSKDKFLIMDCWDNFEYFKLEPQGKTLTSNTPLPITFFELKLKKIEKALELDTLIVKKEIQKLKEFISLFPSGSTTIKDAKNDLDRLDEEFWQAISKDGLEFLDRAIKPLAKSIVGVDYKAMRFEKDILLFSIYLLVDDKKALQTQRDKLITMIEKLPLGINIVAKQKELITQAKQVKFWNHISDSELDILSQKLAPLMKYGAEAGGVDTTPTFDFKDYIKQKEYVEFGADRESVSISRYKQMVEEKVKELLSKNTSLQKLKDGLSLSEDEIESLAKTLHDEDPYITLDLLRRVYMNKKAPFLKFIKHILGLEELKNFPDTVSESFEKFIKEHPTLTTIQLKFLDLLKGYIIDHESISKKDLISAPFTVIHPAGIRGVFELNEIEEILNITQGLVA